MSKGSSYAAGQGAEWGQFVLSVYLFLCRFHEADGEWRLEVGKPQQGRLGATGNKLGEKKKN